MGRQARQEKAITALLETSTIKEASEVSGISQPTLFRYFQDAAFRAKFQKAKGRLLEMAISRVQTLCGDAVGVLDAIMKDTSESPGPRVTAARAILDLSIRGLEIESLRNRLEILEEKVGNK